MPDTVVPPSLPRSRRSARRLDRVKALQLHDAGVSSTVIAEELGVEQSTVWRFLSSTSAESQALAHFKANRADVFARLAAKSLNVQHLIIESLVEDGVLTALTPHQKTGLLAVLSAQHGTLYDKERLEKGQSTSNVSMVHRLMSAAFDRAGKLPISSTPVSSETPDESSSPGRSTTKHE